MDLTIGMNINKDCWKHCGKQNGDCVAFCGTGGKCCKRNLAVASCSGSEGTVGRHGCVAGPSADAVAAAAAQAALDAALAAQARSDAADALANQTSANATAREAAETAANEYEQARNQSDAAAAIAAQAKADADAAAAAKGTDFLLTCLVECHNSIFFLWHVELGQINKSTQTDPVLTATF